MGHTHTGRMQVCPLYKGVLDKWVFGYTQMPVCPLFKGCFGKEGIWVYPATHSNRLPYTHSGRIRASGYLGIPSYPLKSNSVYPHGSNLCEWVFRYTQRPTGYTQLPTYIEFRILTQVEVLGEFPLVIVCFRLFGASGYLGIPSYPLKSNSIYTLRSDSRELVFGYTQLPTTPHPISPPPL